MIPRNCIWPGPQRAHMHESLYALLLRCGNNIPCPAHMNIFKCVLTHFADDPHKVNHCINSLQSPSQGPGIEDIPNVNFCSSTLTRLVQWSLTDQHSPGMSFLLELSNERPSDKTCGSGDENFHMSESARSAAFPLKHNTNKTPFFREVVESISSQTTT